MIYRISRSIALNKVLFIACLLTLFILGCPAKKDEQKNNKPDSNSVQYKTESHKDESVTKERAKEIVSQETTKLAKPPQQAEKLPAAAAGESNDMAPQPDLAEPAEDEAIPAEQSPQEIIKQVSLAMDNNEPDFRLEMMGLLVSQELSDPNVLPVVSRGLKDEDEAVREEAVRALFFVDAPEADKLLIEALSDTSENVRSTAVEVAGQELDNIRWDVFETAMVSPYQDVKTDTVASLIGLPSHETVDILITGLKDTDANFRQEVNSALNLLVSREFNTYEEAVKWWSENKNNYDEELNEKSD